MRMPRKPTPAGALPALASACVLGALTLPTPSWACDDVGDTRTCNPGDPIPDYSGDLDFPVITNWVINGGASAGATLNLPHGFYLGNGDDAPPLVPRDLTLTTTGFLTLSGNPTFAGLVEVINGDGLNVIDLGTSTTLIVDQPVIDPFALAVGFGSVGVLNYTEGNTASLLTESLTLFNGELQFRDTMARPSYGIVTMVDGVAGDARTVLGATARVSFEGLPAPAGIEYDSIAVLSVHTGDGDAIVETEAGSSVVASGFQVLGIAAVAEDGDAIVRAAPGSSVAVTGDDSAAIFATSAGGNVIVESATLTLTGNGDAAVYAESLNGSTSVDATGGTILATGNSSGGIQAYGATAVSVLSGDITTDGLDSAGVYAELTGAGTVQVDTTAGAITTLGNESDGVYVIGGDVAVTVATGDITTSGEDAWGISIDTTSGTIAVDTRGGAIATSGDGGFGVLSITESATGSYDFGDITTTGVEGDGVFLGSTTGDITARVHGNVNVSGDESLGVVLYSVPGVGTGSGALDLTVTGSVLATGRHDPAVGVLSEFNSATVTIGAGALVRGGWEAQPGDTGAITTTGGVGVQLSAGAGATATLNNAGTIGALSDRAVDSSGSAGALALSNTGTLQGFVTLGATDDLFTNAGTWDLRDFADRTGDGVRDVKRVAVADFGAGNDVFMNEAGGTLRLAAVVTPQDTVTDRQYLPDLMPVQSHAIATGGVEQAHLTGLERFEHRGTITLRDMDVGGVAPVAGDVLLLTSGSVDAAGVLTPGAAPLVFLSDGGSLALDVVLNEGGASSHSDMLVVDSVQLGPNGPTRIFVTNAGGLGAATQGAGIKLVDVLGGGALSAEGAFALGAPVVGGAFTYNLFRSAPLGNDGDWYLRTAPPVNPPDPPPVPGPDPEPPPPPPPPGPPVTYRPEAALFAALPAFLRGMDAAVPGSRQARLGDEAGGASVARRGRAWARYLREDLDMAHQGTVNPSSVGEATGFQLGVELYGGADEAAAQIGFYLGRITAEAVVRGYSNGLAGAPVGTLEPEATFAGFYVSRNRGRGLYFDAVLQYAMYDGEALTFADGEVAEIKGRGGYASLELGYGIRPVRQLVIEPQFQLVTQPQRVHDVTIVNAGVRHDPANTLDARAGLRIKGEFGSGAWRFQPYAGASVWRGLDHRDRTHFTGNGVTQTTLVTESELDALELNAGFSLNMGSRLMAFGEYSRLDSRGDSLVTRESTAWSAGLRFAW